MALFKPFRGSRASLDVKEKHDGYAYFCIDDGTFHIDYMDKNGELQRKQLNAKDAETLLGATLVNELTNSETEIPTSKAVGDALALKQDNVIYPFPTETGTLYPTLKFVDIDKLEVGKLYSRVVDEDKTSTYYIGIKANDGSEKLISLISTTFDALTRIYYIKNSGNTQYNLQSIGGSGYTIINAKSRATSADIVVSTHQLYQSVTSTDLTTTDKTIVGAINELNAGKADKNHNHDDIYYTESEIDGLIDGLASENYVDEKVKVFEEAKNAGGIGYLYAGNSNPLVVMDIENTNFYPTKILGFLNDALIIPNHIYEAYFTNGAMELTIQSTAQLIQNDSNGETGAKILFENKDYDFSFAVAMANKDYLTVVETNIDTEFSVVIKDVTAVKTIDPKFLPPNVQSDWNQNDESAPDYIKNRICYENLYKETVTYTFNGNLDSALDYIDIEGGAYFVKIADTAPSIDNLVGGTAIIKTPAEEFTEVITEDMITDGKSANGYTVNGYSVENLALFLFEDVNMAGTVLTKGIWCLYSPEQLTIKEVSYYNLVSKIHKIDEKYLDIATDDEIIEMLMQEDMFPVVTDSNGSMLADENGDILLW